MDIDKLIEAIRLCGSQPDVRQCRNCAYYAGGDMSRCIPRMTADAAEALSTLRADLEQAKRTGWRNIRDWVLAQMAIIEAGMVSMDEVFMPYMTDGRGNTLYQLYQGGQLALGEG